jgi:hypothetical protein
MAAALGIAGVYPTSSHLPGMPGTEVQRSQSTPPRRPPPASICLLPSSSEYPLQRARNRGSPPPHGECETTITIITHAHASFGSGEFR